MITATAATEPFWMEDMAALRARLATDAEGLSEREARQRLAALGRNDLPAAKPRRMTELLHRLKNPLILVLLVAAAFAGITGDLASATIIVAVVVTSLLFDLVQERRAQASMEALRQSIALTASVRRDGAWCEHPVSDIVPGDRVRLAAGDLVPADGIVLGTNALQVNQASITGEAFPVGKQCAKVLSPALGDAENAVFQGSAVISGTAELLVVRTGSATLLGSLAREVGRAPAPTGLERGVQRFGMLIVRVTLFLTLFVLATHLAQGRAPMPSFLFALALAVGLTPELLPMVTTISLARGAHRLARRRVIVKRMSAIHDLGTMDVLCTDKTGTLTEARVTLQSCPTINGADSPRVRELALVNAAFETGLKSPLDAALLQGSVAAPGWAKIDERPFDFERRRVSVLAERDGERWEIVKGAPEAVVPLCVAFEEERVHHPLDAAARDRLNKLEEAHGAAGLRLLAVAAKKAPGADRIADEADFVFVGYCAFVDPPKTGAAAAIEALASAGVKVKIVSGDSAAAVRHVVAALDLPATGLLTGAELALLDDEALAARIEQVDLYARVAPDQKTRIVRALLARGHTVGFLGDGINDAPAIRAADVGLSVDGATDVAREAADVILLAPDLAAVREGVAEGRRSHANIMKYIRMGTSSNVGNMVSMALASLWLPFLPLTPVQVLMNNLIYDVSQAGLPYDRADETDLARPRDWDMRELIRFTAIMAPLSSLFDLLTFGVMLRLFDLDVAAFRTGWFVESMATQILVVLVIRTRHPVWRSAPDPITGIFLLGSLVAAGLLPLTGLGRACGFGRPSAAVFASLAALVVLYLLAAEAMKHIALRDSPAAGRRSGTGTREEARTTHSLPR